MTDRLPSPSSGLATLMGLGAILLWSSLTMLSGFVGPMPALQLTSMAFFIAFFAAVAVWLATGQPLGPKFRMPWLHWVVGLLAVAGNMVFFFIGIRFAPVGQANMLNYLWPLELVILSGLLPGNRLKWTHLLGVGLGALGILALFSGQGEGQMFEMRYFWGYAAAVAGGLCWAVYSVFRRAVPGGTPDAIMVFVGGTAVLTLGLHLAFETTYIPQSLREWAALLLLGIGPTWAAYLLWERGIRHGDIRLLGVGSFMIPLLSTTLLIITGGEQFSRSLALSCLLIVSGAGVASIDALRGKKA